MRRLCGLLAALTLVTGSYAAVPTDQADAVVVAGAATSGPPIRATFYYPWFPETWHSNDRFTPSAGGYSSDNAAVLDRHFASMRYAGLDAAITSWWGQGRTTDRRLPSLLDAAATHDLRVAPYYEPEYGDNDPTVEQVRADLDHLRPLTARRSWLRVDGKPVIFVYNSGATGCADVTRWKRATNNWTDFYVQMKLFHGYADCPDQPDAWHQYGPAKSASVHLPHSYNVSPGFWHHEESTPRLARDLDRFRTDLRNQVASNARWQLVTSFNEWGEGTAVESAAEWASPSGQGDYLDAMRTAYVGAAPAPRTASTTSRAFPVADSHVVSTRPRDNFGKARILRVDRTPRVRSYLKFRVSSKPTKALLRFWVKTSNARGYVAASTSSKWSEKGITYRSAPSIGTRRGATGLVERGTWATIDVSSAIKRSGTFSFVLRTASTRELSASSREGARSPRLVLRYGRTSPTTGTDGEVVVWAVGDSCDDSDRTPGCAEVGSIIAGDPETDHVLALGDLQYESGELADFNSYYDPKMGSGPGLKSRTLPVAGNHEYLTAGASGYFDYFGARAGDPAKGYYAKDLGGWRVVVANTNCSEVGGCEPASAQGQWLASKLSSAPTPCVLVAGHHPALTDGQYAPGVEDGDKVFDAAFDGGAELFLSGHDHQYQRFAPRDDASAIDTAGGVRQFVVGTGGKNLTDFSSTNRSEYRQNTEFGALRLVLRPDGYDWEFHSTAGEVMDEGSGSCH